MRFFVTFYPLHLPSCSFSFLSSLSSSLPSSFSQLLIPFVISLLIFVYYFAFWIKVHDHIVLFSLRPRVKISPKEFWFKDPLTKENTCLHLVVVGTSHSVEWIPFCSTWILVPFSPTLWVKSWGLYLSSWEATGARDAWRLFIKY